MTIAITTAALVAMAVFVCVQLKKALQADEGFHPDPKRDS